MALMKSLAIVFLFLSAAACAQTLQQATLDDLHLALAEEYDTPKKDGEVLSLEELYSCDG